MKKAAWAFDLQKISYGDALSLQRELVALRQKETLPELLLFLEHNHVITFGRGGHWENLLESRESLSQSGVDLFEIERGGDVTYHGPGQLIAYPIFDLNHWERDLHLFLRNLEEVIILTLAEFGLKGERVKGLTGVWVNDKKIAAIGVAVKKWITLHGLALNVNTDLKYFRLIHPCGIIDRPVASMQELLGREVDISFVKTAMSDKFESIFGLTMEQKPPASLFDHTLLETLPQT